MNRQHMVTYGRVRTVWRWFRCHWLGRHVSVRMIDKVEWTGDRFGLRGNVIEEHHECRDCGTPCPG